ncbi:MAG: hypothetical protein HOP12_15535 [Candidatus Eisenbacteria bacterium]|uniref:Uncharacterized protein n=1 Tax=Eiseniibacteriota bacterium TaxID=2212470 RepID=A0A849SLT8_UNCEI|nr:hypothetical protein [Candidatus Eisenbacteria bacterium]
MSDSPSRSPEDQHRKELEAFLASLSADERRQRIVLEPAFRDAYNEITQAHQVVQAPKYFWDHWVPVLGPVASTLYMRLRQHCFYNPRTGERRDFCWPKQETLAREVGIRDRESLRSGLVALELHGFIRREAQYVRDRATGRPRRASDKYQVFFEIPLRDEDAVTLLVDQASKQTTLKTQGQPYAAVKPPHRDSAVEDQPYDAGKPLHQAGGKTASKNKYLEEVPNERNVSLEVPVSAGPGGLNPLGHMLRARERRSTPTTKHLQDVLPQITTSREKRDELLHIEALAGDMLDLLGDSHSRPFYRHVARTFLEAGLERLVRQALSEIKDSDRGGTLRNKAAVFTARVKELAGAYGVDLRRTA